MNALTKGQGIVGLAAVALAAGLTGVVHALAAPGGPAEERGAQVDLSKKPAYWKDARLEKEITFYPNLGPPPVLSQPHSDPIARDEGIYREVRMVQSRLTEPSKLLQKIKDATGVQLMLQGDWMRPLITLPLKPGPARELMDSLADTFRAKWIPVGEGWVLAEGAEQARLTLIPPEEREALLVRENGALFRSFTPGQWRAMAQKDGIPFGILTVQQRATVTGILRLYYYDPTMEWTNVPARKALTGEGVRLEYQGAGKDADVHLSAPSPPGMSDVFHCWMGFYRPQTGELVYGVPPPPHPGQARGKIFASP